MNNVIAAAFVLVSLVNAHATETKSASKVAQTGPSLPLCVKDADQLETIDRDRKMNTKTNLKYKSIQAALASDSSEELVARLVYAETLAANCPDLQNEIITPIKTVIQNRIAKRNGDVRSVVFQRDQFASSLNGYADSKWLDFMCPNNLELWRKAYAATKDPSISASAFNYYLFKHSPRFEVPEWAKKEPAKFSSHQKTAECLKLFELQFK